MPNQEEPMCRLDGRTVLVTGANGGIGAATVRHLVRAGADLIASGRSVEALDALRLKPAAACCRHGFDLWGVVNSGGFGGEIATPMDADIAAFDKVISLNARGALLVTKYWSSRMRHGAERALR